MLIGNGSRDLKRQISNQQERTMKNFVLQIKCKHCDLELLCIPQLDDDELIICRSCRSVGRMKEINIGRDMVPGTLTEKQLLEFLAEIGM